MIEGTNVRIVFISRDSEYCVNQDAPHLRIIAESKHLTVTRLNSESLKA